jgi:predicted TIM-barrel fold metal-dependent hydrolase
VLVDAHVHLLPDRLARAIRRFFVDRLLFGSDAANTVVTIEQAVAHVRALELDGGAESAVLGGTAARLLAA